MALLFLVFSAPGVQSQVLPYDLEPPSNLHVEGVECAAFLTWNKPLVSGITPPGILGYRVYRDGNYIVYVSGVDTTWYYDFLVEPGTHTYAVSALYDLTVYGYPGFTDESVQEGPFQFTLTCSSPCFLFEQWDVPSFNWNDWEFYPAQGNWDIALDEGFPAPTAVFRGTPALTSYSYDMFNYAIDIFGFYYATIHIDYDIRLEDVAATGTEKLLVELFYNQTWYLIDQFSNTGSFDWEHRHLEFPYDGGRSTIRFRALGENSAHLGNWYVDNIYATSVCHPPVNPEAGYTGSEVILTWHPPVYSPPVQPVYLQEELQYHEGHADTSFLYYFDWAYGTLFDLSEFINLGIKLVEIDFHIANSTIPGPWNYRIHVVDWNGYSWPYEIATAGPFQTTVSSGWETAVPLDSVNVSFGSTIGIFIQPMGLVPDNAMPRVSVDTTGSSGSSVYGPFSWFSAFDTLTSGEYLINLRILVQDTTTDHQSGNLTPDTVMQQIIGYNVFRSLDTLNTFEQLNQDPVQDTTFTDVNPPSAATATFYYIQALFKDAYCESIPSDTVEVLVTALSSHAKQPEIGLFPNPASGVVTIQAEEPLVWIRLFNPDGRCMLVLEPEREHTVHIDVSALPQGLYMAEIKTDSRVTRRAISIVR